MNKFYCLACSDEFDEDGNPVPEDEPIEVSSIRIDGYQFADTLLEGIDFRLDQEGNVTCVENWEANSYLRRLNKPLLFKEAVDYFKNWKLYGDSFRCGQCSDDITEFSIDIVKDFKE